MEKDILTTSQAAHLLGISVRTAQLFMEGGTLTSWKTPGGHRRVYRADVLAFMAKKKDHSPAFSSARVVLLASPARRPLLEGLLSTVGECAVEAYGDVYATSFAIGYRLPAVVVVDLADARAERRSLLYHLADHPALGQTRLVAVGRADAMAMAPDRAPLPVRVVPPEQLPDAILTALTDADAPLEHFEFPLSFPLADNEGQRLVAVDRSGLVDTAPEEAFDRLTWLAGQNLRMPIALMTLLTPTRQWFKSRQGLELTQTPRSWAFCNHTVLQKGVFAVEDLSRATLFADNPAVANSPHFRFYAGAPVVDPDGFALGSLCVMDYQPRALNATQEQTLLALAGLASDEVRLRAANRQFRWARDMLERRQQH
ncbi:GAF domain-containing protein [Acerihabitans arboris]|uniref:Excisionase family DNA-binding protein n=1 Tax=Acerihabitans arboris TaxID=2691583 RepID=A0A845SHA7_9GAMM|nr:GAF domain-containing protein [Acerihabitans arboris]NDL63249.1 excisionase family DNA-binding protein [Acerihabitans arboris]